jgi:hypothetical protein
VDARGPQGSRRNGGGRREGGTQTSDVARRGAWTPCGQRVRRFGMCRGARKPREGSIVRREIPRDLGTVRGCCDGPLKGSGRRTEGVVGAAMRTTPPILHEPGGRKNAERAYGTHVRGSGSALSSKRTVIPREGRSLAARRPDGSHHCSSLRRAAADNRTDSIVRLRSALSPREWWQGPFHLIFAAGDARSGGAPEAKISAGPEGARATGDATAKGFRTHHDRDVPCEARQQPSGRVGIRRALLQFLKYGLRIPKRVRSAARSGCRHRRSVEPLRAPRRMGHRSHPPF